MAEEKGGKWSKVIILVVVILLVIIILITLLVGLKGLKQFFIWLIAIILILGILFGLMYVFYLIFIQKSFKDIPATYRKKLMQTAKMMKNEMLGDLYLSGDEKHNRIKLGKFRYLRITLPKQSVETIDVKPTKDNPLPIEKEKVIEKTKPVKIDCFLIIKKGLMDKLFGNPIFVLVKPQDHNYSSIFSDVTISGFNLVPLDSQFYTIDKRNLDVDIIKGMATNYIREVVYEIFRDLDKLVKQAMNLDQQFQKDKQKNLEFEIPKLGNIGGEQR
jgi:hypothetical protein